ncbi:hypothetical protein [Clostridium sp. Marseille-P3244]|uniref:hypothetical protein n=1 Tax=Clostridium sp. Marseille-P3244 TaxID=1871020 RepID=UPI0009310603|nr:hypothetical protein [Clostridium sp. Marseille-P3244]
MKKKIVSLLVVTVMVLSLVACGSEKHDNSSSEETKVTEEKSDEKIGEDFHADVEAGLLWINKQGRVTDKDGNIIDAYSYITANDRKTLISDGDIMAGYTMTDDMQIIIDEEYISMTEEDSVGDTDYSYTLLSIADPSVKGRQMTVSEEKQAGGGSNIYTRIVDDRSEYHSDIIYGNWWVDHQINGTPIAYYVPENLHGKLARSGLSTYAGYESNPSVTLDDFKLIDQDTCTVDSIKRSDPDDFGTYAFYLENCQKQTDESGNMYFTGYIDADYVAVYGGFDNILNGDNVFMYADYVGLSTNDVPIFVGAYAEFVEEYNVDADASSEEIENTDNSVNVEKLPGPEYKEVTVEELYEDRTSYSGQYVEVTGTIGAQEGEDYYLFPVGEYEPAIPMKLEEGVSAPDILTDAKIQGYWTSTLGPDTYMFLFVKSIEEIE